MILLALVILGIGWVGAFKVPRDYLKSQFGPSFTGIFTSSWRCLTRRPLALSAALFIFLTGVSIMVYATLEILVPEMFPGYMTYKEPMQMVASSLGKVFLLIATGLAIMSKNQKR